MSSNTTVTVFCAVCSLPKDNSVDSQSIITMRDQLKIIRSTQTTGRSMMGNIQRTLGMEVLVLKSWKTVVSLAFTIITIQTQISGFWKSKTEKQNLSPRKYIFSYPRRLDFPRQPVKLQNTPKEYVYKNIFLTALLSGRSLAQEQFLFLH